MIELSLLKALSNKNSFDSYRYLLNPQTLSQQSLTILKDYESYFNQFIEHKEIDFTLFLTYFFQTRHPYFDDKSITEYKEILQQLSKLELTSDIKELYIGFEKQEFYLDLQNKLNQNIDIEELHNEVSAFKDKFEGEGDTEEETITLKQSLHTTDRQDGLRWKLPCLDNWFQGQGLSRGDLVVIAATPGSGKTSFLAQELSYMAGQIEDGVVYYLSNEGHPENIVNRLYCSVLNCTEIDLRKFPEKASRKFDELLGKNKIKVKNIQGWTANDIEKLIKKKTPKLLVIDLLDNVQGFSKYVTKESSFEMYHKLYQWARELSTQYCPVLAASQTNGDAWDKPNPSISNLRGSRVDKQGAVTFQIMIGKTTGQDTRRYISLVKDKLGIGYKNASVSFDPLRCKFE